MKENSGTTPRPDGSALARGIQAGLGRLARWGRTWRAGLSGGTLGSVALGGAVMSHEYPTSEVLGCQCNRWFDWDTCHGWFWGTLHLVSDHVECLIQYVP